MRLVRNPLVDPFHAWYVRANIPGTLTRADFLILASQLPAAAVNPDQGVL